MAVYVDSCTLRYKGMFMCHMIADTSEELMDMADKVGLNSKWLQNGGSYREHFDLCKTKRAQAVEHGAKEVTLSELVTILNHKREEALGKGPKNPKRKYFRKK